MLEKFHIEQEEFYDFAKKIVENKKISHAYFIETSSYEDGKYLAKDFAKYLILENLKENCNNIDLNNIESLIDSNNYKDLYIINPDGQNIKKEQIIALKDEFSNKSLTNTLRIYIINEADKLNKASANSMLKFLEEPEENIVAILVAENRYNVIKTLLSRCQCIKLKSNENQDNNDDLILNMFDFIMNIERNGLKTICYLNNLWHNKYNTKEQFNINFDILSKIYMDSINLSLNKKLCFNNNLDDLKYISSHNSMEEILTKIKIVNKYRDNLKYNLNVALMMDKFIIDIVGGGKYD